MRPLPAIIFLEILLFAVFAQAADLQASETIVDFGNVKEGAPVVKTITLTNIGSQTINIDNAAAS
jgi:hypothetical protein